MADSELNQQISEAKFDLAIVDGLDFYRCLLMIPYRHNIKYVTVSPKGDPWSARVSASAAAEGFMSGNYWSEWLSDTVLLRKLSIKA